MFKNVFLYVLIHIGAVLYFVLASKECYRGLSGGFIPSLYYPIAVVCALIVVFSMFKIRVFKSIKESLKSCIMFFTVLISITLIINSMYGAKLLKKSLILQLAIKR